MGPNKKLKAEQGGMFFGPERYRRLVGKLIYLTIIGQDLSFVVDVESIHAKSLY